MARGGWWWLVARGGWWWVVARFIKALSESRKSFITLIAIIILSQKKKKTDKRKYRFLIELLYCYNLFSQDLKQFFLFCDIYIAINLFQVDTKAF